MSARGNAHFGGLPVSNSTEIPDLEITNKTKMILIGAVLVLSRDEGG